MLLHGDWIVTAALHGGVVRHDHAQPAFHLANACDQAGGGRGQSRAGAIEVGGFESAGHGPVHESWTDEIRKSIGDGAGLDCFGRARHHAGFASGGWQRQPARQHGP